MAVIKTYSSTCNFRTSCGEKEILFSPCYIQNDVLHRGTYTTADKEEQRVIERDYFFGNRVFLDSVQNIDEPVEEAVTEPVEVQANEAAKEEMPTEEQPTEESENTGEEDKAIEKTIVEEVTTFDEAATYMKEHYNLAESKVCTEVKLRKRMKEYNVEFPNLVIEK